MINALWLLLIIPMCLSAGACFGFMMFAMMHAGSKEDEQITLKEEEKTNDIQGAS